MPNQARPGLDRLRRLFPHLTQSPTARTPCVAGRRAAPHVIARSLAAELLRAVALYRDSLAALRGGQTGALSLARAGSSRDRLRLRGGTATQNLGCGTWEARRPRRAREKCETGRRACVDWYRLRDRRWAVVTCVLDRRESEMGEAGAGDRGSAGPRGSRCVRWMRGLVSARLLRVIARPVVRGSAVDGCWGSWSHGLCASPATCGRWSIRRCIQSRRAHGILADPVSWRMYIISGRFSARKVRALLSLSWSDARTPDRHTLFEFEGTTADIMCTIEEGQARVGGPGRAAALA